MARRKPLNEEQRERRRAKKRAWHAKNRERVNQSRRLRRTAPDYKKRQRSEREKATHRVWLAKNAERVRQAKRAHREKNREKIRAQGRARYAADPEKFRAATRAQHAAHPERRRQAAKLYVALHKEERKEYQSAYNAKHADKKSRASLEWQRANPEKARLNSKRTIHKRRALLHGSQSPGFTSAQWCQMVEHFGGRCAYCGGPGTTIDHVVPISAGGRDEIQNVLPACKRCNASKGSRKLETWLLKKGLSDPRPSAAAFLEHVDHGNSVRRRARSGARI